MSKKEEYNYLSYGEKCKSSVVKTFINHMMDVNKDSKNPVPLCIWGLAGIGKTSIVEQIAAEKGYQYQYIAPAQFEEMGDLLGMPYTDKETGVTKFAIPDWVPQVEGPGILLIDDVNRADDRILRGIMQLLQNYELISWRLPKGWQIVLTANPDGGDYSVTPMDDAMLTRMMHITMEFDVKEWALWAEKNGIDSRGINFILKYPEVVKNGNNPRALTHFFKSISNIPDLRENMVLVNILSKSTLDRDAAVQFQQFVNDNLVDLINPEDIISTSKFSEVEATIKKQSKGTDGVRLDIINIIVTRVIGYIGADQNRNFNKKELDNIINFLRLDFIPKDITFAAAQDIMNLATQKKMKSLIQVIEAAGVLDKLL